MRSRLLGLHVGALAALVTLAGCGGKAVVDAPLGNGGAGGTGATSSDVTATTVGSPSVASVTTGPGGCADHAQCPGGVCIFSTGVCAPSCGDVCDTCGSTTICEPCATSSCPGCEDCRGACVPAETGRCDEDTPCASNGDVCLFGGRTCARACTADEQCGDFAFCAPCASGSCCGCDDCVSACVGGE